MNPWAEAGIQIGSSALDFIGGHSQNKASRNLTRDAMHFSALQAQKQMDFQERMSGSAHQREVIDLQKAGLNPLLSLNSGASTPGGAMATGEVAPVVNELGAFAGSARESLRTREEFKVMRGQAKKAIADAGLSEEELKYARSNPAVYFASKYGSADTAGAMALDSIMRMRRGISSAKSKLSMPSWRSWFTGPNAEANEYMTDAEMRRRGAERREQKRRSGPTFNRRHSN